MKQRLFACLFVLTMMLTGCGFLPGVLGTSEQTAEQPPTTTSEIQPTETAAPSRFSGSVTAGGFRVQTDDANYRSYTGERAVYTRLREGPLDTFEPSGDYGAVYPYVAARLFTSDESGASWENGAMYGFVDRSGRILTDGIYTSIEPMASYDYDFDQKKLLPFWITKKVVDPVVRTDPDYPEYRWIDGDTQMGVVSHDGRFALPCEYKGIQMLENGFVCYRAWDKPDFEVYDLDGKLVLTGAELIDEGSEGWYVDYGDGLYTLSVYYDGDVQTSWFCDAEGKRVLGPYEDAEHFQEGLACVSTDGEHYGYIDKTGAWVIDPEYQGGNSFQNGRAVQYTMDDRCVLLDAAGNRLLTTDPDEWIYAAPCGFRRDSSNDNTVNYYDLNGNLLVSGDCSLECLDEETFCRNTDGQTEVFRLNGEKQSFDETDYMFCGAAMLNGKPVSGYRAVSYEDDRELFLPLDLSGVYEITSLELLPNGYSAYYADFDDCTGEKWDLIWDGSFWSAVSEAGKQRSIPLRASTVHLRGDRIMAITDRACVYLDADGEIVFYYPLDAED